MSTDHSHDTSQRLERLVDELLRAQPQLRAPADLQTRVWTRIEAGTRHWWRRPFVYWPVSARWLFALTAVGFAALSTRLMDWLALGLSSTHVGAAFASEAIWVDRARRVLVEISDLHSMVIQSIPVSRISILLTIIMLLYAALFGLGAAAYRTLYRRH